MSICYKIPVKVISHRKWREPDRYLSLSFRGQFSIVFVIILVDKKYILTEVNLFQTAFCIP